jgi:hypothetical protein
MELLIPGLILVALMVYASTRIKRVAAQAFEPETIDTDDFTLEKPDGFLNVLNRDPALALDIYSRDMGAGDEAEFRAARGEVRVYEQRTLDYATNAIRESTRVTSEMSEVISERKYRILEAEKIEKGAEFRELYKIVENDGSVFEFKIVALKETNDELKRKIDIMFNSFMLK